MLVGPGRRGALQTEALATGKVCLLLVISMGRIPFGVSVCVIGAYLQLTFLH